MEVFGMEISPIALGLGLVAGVISLIVLKSVEVPLIWRVLTFILSFVVGVGYSAFQQNKG